MVKLDDFTHKVAVKRKLDEFKHKNLQGELLLIFCIFVTKSTCMNILTFHWFAIQKAVTDLAKGKYWLYMIPSLVVAFIFFGIFNTISSVGESAEALDSVPLVGSWLVSGVKSTLSFIDMLTMLVFQFFILTLLSPVSCLLSEKVDETHSGKNYPFDFGQFVLDLIRALFIVLLSTFAYMFFVFLWWFISKFIPNFPGFSYIDSFMYFSISAFFLGFSFYDFSLERHKVNFFYSWGFAFEKMGYMIATGALFSVIFLIPMGLGIILAPFFVTIVSTLVYLQIENKIQQTNDTVDEKSV